MRAKSPDLSPFLLVFLLVAAQSLAAVAQEQTDSANVSVDTLAVNGSNNWLAQRDSLWLAWCAEAHCVSTDSAIWYAGTSSKEIAQNLDTAFVLRSLMDLNTRTPMDLMPHGAVLSRVSFMLKHRPRFLGKMMGRSAQYFPLFEEALDRHGLPLELKYLPVLESGLNPLARSGAGATGLWQFMYNTGRHQGLQISKFLLHKVLFCQRSDTTTNRSVHCRIHETTIEIIFINVKRVNI